MRKKTIRATMSSDTTIGERVKNAMRTRGMDQKTLAEALQVSEGYISRILNGHRVYTISLVLKISQALDVSVNDIDPLLPDCLKQDLLGLELRGDVPQLAAVYVFIKTLPRVDHATDLQALMTVLDAFAANAEARRTSARASID